jgi:membrane protein CcdC involved in cytochrome C biogenesis
MERFIEDLSRLSLTQLTVTIFLMSIGVLLPWSIIIYEKLKNRTR